MKNVTRIFKNDFVNYFKYRIIHMIFILSIVLGIAMGIFTNIDPLVFVYITIFIFPVITFAVSFYIEREDDTILPNESCEFCPFQLVIGKIMSAISIQLLPLLIYTIIMKLVLNMNFSLILFILVFILSSIIHVLIGLSLAIIAKSNLVMSLSYIVYILVFSVLPFLSLAQAIPSNMEYFLIISPAFLSGVLFENIVFGYLFSDLLLVSLSVSTNLFCSQTIFQEIFNTSFNPRGSS